MIVLGADVVELPTDFTGDWEVNECTRHRVYMFDVGIEGKDAFPSEIRRHQLSVLLTRSFVCSVATMLSYISARRLYLSTTNC
jgi:hypothetical protein